MLGVIVKGVGGLYTVMSDGVCYSCSARGKLRQRGMMSPLIGDRVEITKADGDDYAIEKIYERESVLIRPNVANVNQLLITFAVSQPKPDLLLADKLTVAAAKQNINAVICITKSDIDSADKYRKIYEQAGFETVVTGLCDEDRKDVLDRVTKGKITAVAGCSGVGKSTLINTLCKDRRAETGEISRKTERGRHTTRHTELIVLENGGYILDTPGFSSYEAEKGGRLSDYFIEFSRYGACRFADCTHTKEPGCIICDAVQSGEISESRYGNYVKILTEQTKKERYK